jgi:hypothetical protein
LRSHATAEHALFEAEGSRHMDPSSQLASFQAPGPEPCEVALCVLRWRKPKFPLAEPVARKSNDGPRFAEAATSKLCKIDAWN